MPSIGARLRAVMKRKLRRFQIRAVRFTEKRNGRVIIGDEMGLGKTAEAIAWAAINPKARPALVICPASVKYNWEDELRINAGLRCTVLSGRNPRPFRPRNGIAVINYAILWQWRDLLSSMHFRLAILDECHHIKNRQAKRTQAASMLASACPHVICISGTPIVNKPVEYFPILHLIDPDAFPAFWPYAMRYCSPCRGYRGRGWLFPGATHVEELHAKTSGLIIRRTKAEVLTELPPKVSTTLRVDITNAKAYKRAEDNVIKYILHAKGRAAATRAMRAPRLAKLSALTRITAEGKIAPAIEWIRDFLDTTDQKLVVFGVHRNVIDGIHKKFRGALRIDGSVPTSKRGSIVNAFQTQPTKRLFLGNIRAAGEGITLHAASTVLFVEFGWTPGGVDQAAARVHRLGQKASRINIYFMAGRGTVDEKILSVIHKKRDVVGRVVDGDTPTATATAVVNLLQKERKQ